MSAYLMISLNTQVFLSLNTFDSQDFERTTSTIDFATHPPWNHQTGWLNVLDNFRLIIQLILLLWLISPWLKLFSNSSLLRRFSFPVTPTTAEVDGGFIVIFRDLPEAIT